jgi:peptidoglycan/LPS O-acetylase OafA/YrhL
MIFHVKPGWLPFGWAAVDLFFVLSGYLITSIILRQGQTPGFLRNFYIRRGLRTWPIYYIAIAVIIILSPILLRPCDWTQLPAALTYTQGLTPLWGGSTETFSRYLSHTWSLAIEEQFYLVWPALALAVGPRRVGILALACAGTSILARSQGIWWTSLTRADGLALGSFLAVLRWADERREGHLLRWTPIARRTIRFAGIAALAVLCGLAWKKGLKPDGALTSYPMLTLFSFNVFWLGVLELVVANAGRPYLRFLRVSAMRRLGVISYGLYLYHYPLLLIAFDVARQYGVGRSAVVRLLAVLLSIPLAALSWRYIECPLLDLKRRYSYARKPDRLDLVHGEEGAGMRPRRWLRHVHSAPAMHLALRD